MVNLEEFITRSDKEASFTLPLDASTGTGSRLGLSLRQIPASVYVMTQEVIASRGLRTTVETVNSIVGVQGGLAVGSIPRYTMRGLSGNQITILQDGIRMNTQSQSERPVDAFNLDRVEVLKGPSSVLFGEGAIGGSINYVSKSPDWKSRHDLLVSYGSFDTWRLGVGVGGPLGQALAYRVDLSTSNSRGYVDRNETALFSGTTALTWNVSKTFILNLHAAYTEDTIQPYYGTPVVHDGVVNTLVRGSAARQDVANPNTDRFINPRFAPESRRQNYDITNASADSVNLRLRLVADAHLSPEVTLRNTLYGVHHFLQSENFERYRYNSATKLVQRDFIWQAYRNDLMVGDRIEVRSDHKIAGLDNRLLVGVDVSKVHYERGINAGGFPDSPTTPNVALTGFDPGQLRDYRIARDRDVDVDTVALFAEEALKLRRDLTLVAGLRYDHIDTTRYTLADATRPMVVPVTASKVYRPITWRTGVVYEVASETNLYASMSYAQEPANQLVSLPTAAASLALPLQKSVQYEVGTKRTFWEGRADATLAFYRIDRRDVATTDRLSDGTFVTQSIGKQHSHGVELAVSVAPTNTLRVEGAFAWTDAKFDRFNENIGGVGLVSRTGNRPVDVPKVVASLWVSYDFSGGWFISGGPRYVSDRWANNNNSIQLGGYTELEVAFGYKWRAWTVTLRGRNLLDRTYSDTAIYGGVLQRLADPRSFELSVRAAF